MKEEEESVGMRRTMVARIGSCTGGAFLKLSNEEEQESGAGGNYC
jgi:hypothetical protein